jgi:RNA polymerase sigma factor (sigma-70 family)
MDRLALTPAPVPVDIAISQLNAEAIPLQIGRYRILGRLGAGGMGMVYRAHDEQMRRDVAIKVPRFDGPTAAAEAARQRFLREARAAAAAVRHPHVCPIYDVSEQDGRPFVVMAWVDGCSLAERLKEGPFADCSAAVGLICQVADGLSAVHAARIIHRDLKPGNILLDKGGQALLADFGLAHGERDTEHITAEGALLGTPAYMAPEQVEPELGAVGPGADQYSLAVVLYQVLTGRLPFEGSVASLIRQIATNTPPSPSQYRPGLDANLERIVLKALARRPQDRYPSVTQFRRALLDWGEKQSIGNTQSLPSPLPAARPRRRLPILVGGLVLLAGFIGMGTWALIRIQTEHGHYVIDTDDPDFSFQVSKEGVTLEDRKTELDRWTALHEAVEQLPAELRQVFSCTFYHGWTQGQIAELLGISDRQVRRLWVEACLRLKEAVGTLPAS